MTDCTDCDDTGYTADGYIFGRGPCTCDGRPFEPSTATPTPPITVAPISRAEHARRQIIETDNYTAAVVAIDDLMCWCRAALGPVIALGGLSYYAEHAAFDVVAPRVLRVVDQLEAALAARGPVVDRLRAAALDQLGEAAA